MPRPKNKTELISLSNSNYQKLLDFIDQFSTEEQITNFPEGTMNRNIRDILAHLHHWHLMMSDWYQIGMLGKKPMMPAKGYTWKTVPELNKKIWEMYQRQGLNEVKKLLQGSFDDLQIIIEQHTDEELFEKKRYKWTGSTSLGAYLVSATSSHYDWAFKLIKKSKK
jgi:hypothetical protein